MEQTKNQKIVQLTKVIYHLNTQIEEHDEQIKNLNSSYENEIEQILQDSYTKMEQIREGAKIWEERAKNNQLYRDLLYKYDQEKKLTMKELEKIKQNQHDEIKKIRDCYKNEIISMQNLNQ